MWLLHKYKVYVPQTQEKKDFFKIDFYHKLLVKDVRGSYTSWYVLLRTSWQPILQILSFSNLEGRHTLVYCSFCVSVTFPYLKNYNCIISYPNYNKYYVHYITYNSSAVKMKKSNLPLGNDRKLLFKTITVALIYSLFMLGTMYFIISANDVLDSRLKKA